MTAHPRDRHTWRPDDGTVGWLMGRIDEAAVGRHVMAQLGMTEGDPAKIGEAAVESVLFTALRMVRDAQKVPPGTPI